MNPEKPRLVVSACLLGERVRYDGRSAEDEEILSMLAEFEVLPVCPEIGIGLGVPRERVIAYLSGGELRVSQLSTGRDLTEDLREFSARFLRSVGKVDGFVLKSRSPSCGVSGTKTYADPWGKRFVGRGMGIFALFVMNAFPHYPIEDEEGLKDPQRRLLFLTKVWLLWSMRSGKRNGGELPEDEGKALRYVENLNTEDLKRLLRLFRDGSENP